MQAATAREHKMSYDMSRLPQKTLSIALHMHQLCFYHRSPSWFRSIAYSLCPTSGPLSVFYVRKERRQNYFFGDYGGFTTT